MDTKDELPETQEDKTAAPDSGWTYNQDEAADDQTQATFGASIAPVKWTASEFVSHDKSAAWFLALIGATLIIAAITYLITLDRVTVGVVIIVAFLFGVMANRKPKTLEYGIDNKGVTIGPKLYSFTNFKSFSVIVDGALAFIQLMPVNRLSPPISVYYPPTQEDEIIETLGSYLPHEDRKRDGVDRLMSKIRF